MSSKWVQKQQTTRNINNAFGPGSANEHTVQGWFKKFCEGGESLENEEYSGRPSEVGTQPHMSFSDTVGLEAHHQFYDSI